MCRTRRPSSLGSIRFRCHITSPDRQQTHILSSFIRKYGGTFKHALLLFGLSYFLFAYCLSQDTGFGALLDVFEGECAKAGYIRDESVAGALEAAALPTGKRSFTQSSSSSSSSRGRGRGGGGSRGGSNYSRGAYNNGGAKRARRGSRY